jgi:hypothetical protein
MNYTYITSIRSKEGSFFFSNTFQYVQLPPSEDKLRNFVEPLTTSYEYVSMCVYVYACINLTCTYMCIYIICLKYVYETCSYYQV